MITTQAVAITVLDVNEAPYFNDLATEIGYGRTITISDGVFIFLSSVTTVSASDPEDDTLSFGVSGTDADYFNISSSGALTFKSYDLSQTKAEYAIAITVSDEEFTTSQDVAITVSRDDTITVVSKQPNSTDIINASAGTDLSLIHI